MAIERDPSTELRGTRKHGEGRVQIALAPLVRVGEQLAGARALLLATKGIEQLLLLLDKRPVELAMELPLQFTECSLWVRFQVWLSAAGSDRLPLCGFMLGWLALGTRAGLRTPAR